MQISEIAIRRPILTLMSIGSLIVFGLVAQETIGFSLYPDVDMPMVSVSLVYEGASPKTVETEVTEVLEEALSTISGIKSMRSDTSEGVAQVFLEFDLERDVDVAAQDVRDKLSAVQSELPIDAEAPVVDKFDPDAAPILGIVLSGPSSIRDLTLLADDTIKPQIESINGVGGVRVTGGREREIRVWLRLDDLKARSLSAQDVIDALKKENVEFPGGRIEAGARELVVETRGRVPQVADFRDLIVARRQQSVVRLHEVAVIEDGMEDQRSMARLNGVSAVSMSVRQQSGTNMVAVADVVKAKLDQIRSVLPEGHKLLVIQDLSTFVQSSVDEAQGELLRGGTLAVLVILLFLRSLRGAFVSAVTIPSTIVSTYAFMLAMGFTLNMMTLLALTISVGMIIDDSIVVLENTYRHMQTGLSRMQAAVAAMNEIGFAVIVTSLSIAAVFVPVAFMDGLVGQFFYEFGMTVTFAVVVSTVIAMSLSPMLCARLLVLPKETASNQKPSTKWFRRWARRFNPGRAIEAVLTWTEQTYGRLLFMALNNRVIVLASALGLFIASGFLLPLIGQEFTPSEDEGQFSVQVEAPVGSSIHQTDRIAAAVEERIGRLPFIQDIYTTIGGQYEGMVTVADVMVKLVEKEDRTLSQAELMTLAREQLSDLSHLRLSVNAINRTGRGGGMRTAPIQYNLRGDSMEELTAFADTVVRRLRATPGFVDVNTTSQTGKPEVSVTIDRDRASDLGVKVEDVGKAVSALIGGQKVTTFEDDGKSIDVRLRLVGSDREQARAIQALPLRRLDGQLTELRNLAAVDMTLGPVTIERQSRKRQVTVLANLEATKPLGEGVEDVRKLESELQLPDGVVSIFTGSADMMAESFASILFCLFMAVVLTYMILAAQFESFLHPFTIMLSLPLSVGGALGGLFLLGRTLNIFSMIGMVMLMGLVTKNAILLVDYTNLLRSRGVEKTEALLQAGPVRLRPILMTALSTIAGLIPVALGLGDGAASRAPMGACVVGGMITSTFLTLIVIPVVYSVVESAYDTVIQLFRSEERQHATTPATLSANVAGAVARMH
jgi:HAE1 family hydrophobic/amphiphilic exporter-1